MQTQTFKQTVRRHVRGFIGSLFRNNSNPAWQGRNHNHLESEYRRKLSSPLAAASLLISWIMADEDAVKILQQNPADQPQLMRVAVVGDEIRINLYRLELFPGGPLTRPFNDNWAKDGIIDFTMVLRDGKQHYQHLLHDLRADLSYDAFEPYASLTLPLVAEEMDSINAVTTPAWRQLS
ncbi:hypothetical protein [Xanthomonas phage RTH11]|nr:hypothetical protein [Xanthomonas phage RTH11]